MVKLTCCKTNDKTCAHTGKKPHLISLSSQMRNLGSNVDYRVPTPLRTDLANLGDTQGSCLTCQKRESTYIRTGWKKKKVQNRNCASLERWSRSSQNEPFRRTPPKGEGKVIGEGGGGMERTRIKINETTKTAIRFTSAAHVVSRKCIL